MKLFKSLHLHDLINRRKKSARLLTSLTILGAAGASAFAPGSSATAAAGAPSQPVVVTNTTPVPVSGTVNLGGSITSTITGTPNVNVANNNPIPVTQTFPGFSTHLSVDNQSGSPSTASTTVQFPSGYAHLVIDSVSYNFLCNSAQVPQVPKLISVNYQYLPVPVPTGGPAYGWSYANTVPMHLNVGGADFPDSLTVYASIDSVQFSGQGLVDACGSITLFFNGHFEP